MLKKAKNKDNTDEWKKLKIKKWKKMGWWKVEGKKQVDMTKSEIPTYVKSYGELKYLCFISIGKPSKEIGRHLYLKKIILVMISE